MRAEVLALWGLLWFASQLSINTLWVSRDSKVLIEHLKKGSSLDPGRMVTWMEQIKVLRDSFSSIYFQHIFRENNSQADMLSKKVLIGIFGVMNYELTDSDGHGAVGSVNFV